jgi:hypothetical protein
MPPRYSYWTIIAGGLPTAFRAYEREELMPTFTRLREKHPDAEMKWFARGKLWASPDAAREDTERRRGGFAREGGRPPRAGQAREAAGRPAHGDPARQPEATRRAGSGDRARNGDAPGEPPRNRGWRPGGEHRDPRQKYKDAKKAKNLGWRREKFARKQHDGDRVRAPGAPPDSGKREWDRPRGSAPASPPASSGRFDGDRRGGKRDWDRPREGGPAPPKRFDSDQRAGGKREWSQPREGAPRGRDERRPRDEYRARGESNRQDRPPQRDEPRPLPERDRSGPPRQDWRRKPGSTGRDWNQSREGASREKPRGDEFRPRGRDEHRPRDQYRAREDNNRQDRPPRRDEPRPLPERDRSGPPRQDWRRKPASTRPDWNQSREGAPREKPRGNEFRPRGRDEYRPRDEYRTGDDRNRPDRPPRRDEVRPLPERTPTRPPRPDWREKPAGAPKPFARENRGDGSREWDKPRDRSTRETERLREGGKREWNKPRDAAPATPKRHPVSAREGGRPFLRKDFERNQGTEVPPPPPRPPGPNREPRPSESPKPDAPPRPAEPEVLPPGPPERGRIGPDRFGPPGRLNKSKRRP